MKKLFLLLFPVCLFSQENCFDDGQKHYRSGMGLLDIKDTLESILFNNPKHVKFKENKNNTSYEKDEMYDFGDSASPTISIEKQTENKKITEKFSSFFNNQFSYIQFQKEKNSLYAVAQSSSGYWLLEIKNKKPKAYYIGFSKNTYINRNQKEKFIQNNKLYLDGSFLTVKSKIRFAEMEAVKDYLTFEVNLADIKKDSDNDGYNDFFEKLIYLNPQSKDTDGDGISDFDDLNPLHKSEKGKFISLYEEIIDLDASIYCNSENHYSFELYDSDCEYFQKVNPQKRRVLILSGTQAYQLNDDYRNLLGTFYGRIKNGSDEKTFYIPYFKKSSGGRIIAEYKNGKWSIFEDLQFKV
ncbi:hypothetical protein SAMN05443633_11035 [Chryseobacterium arachidis]|uniref:Uncharacterized protein n=1 Tax=Chryseobacterium arachidis TaxID=1416778 RepID=A0A1M5H077_9FLAO|nr:hypothetical protein [Chryseobacterium arachidis]SHG09393.1 hypothetical protein SAMN05443633_11035 [Chryseobacterium arachidis]